LFTPIETSERRLQDFLKGGMCGRMADKLFIERGGRALGAQARLILPNSLRGSLESTQGKKKVCTNRGKVQAKNSLLPGATIAGKLPAGDPSSIRNVLCVIWGREFPEARKEPPQMGERAARKKKNKGSGMPPN